MKLGWRGTDGRLLETGGTAGSDEFAVQPGGDAASWQARGRTEASTLQRPPAARAITQRSDGPAALNHLWAVAGRRLGPEWRRAWLWGATLWAASRLSIVVTTYFGILLAVPGGVASPPQLVTAWKRWDANWYVEIGAHGYAQPQSPAFFPLYPLLIAALHVVLPWLSLFSCAVVLSNLGLLAALVLLVRQIDQQFGPKVAYNTALLLLAYPAAFFLSTAYAEGVFLAFVFGAFGALRSGRWPLAGLLAALATLTRPTGLMLVIPFAWEYLRQSPITWVQMRDRTLHPIRWGGHGQTIWILLGRLLSLGGMPLAVGAYSSYLWWRFGQPLLFKRVEGAYWNHQHATPIGGLVMGLEALTRFPLLSYGEARGLLDDVPIIFFVGVLLLGARRLPVAYTLFGLSIVVLSLTAPIPGSWPLQSGIRYLMPAFPVFVALSVWGQRWPALQTALLYTWLPLQVVLILLFIHGQWII